MHDEEFRAIPGYESYGVSRNGVIKSIVRDKVLSKYLFNGYEIVDVFYESLTETLPVHRAVALAWVDNPDPDINIVVNHKDGVKLNNWWENLEWVTYSGNNYHAINTGLRNDNIRCRLRDFTTGEVLPFSSMSQASRYMGLSRDTPACMLLPKKFGTLIKDRYEFRFEDDPTPWFYEKRTQRIKPARFMIVVEYSDNTVREVFSIPNLLKGYQLYDCPSRKVLELAAWAGKKHPDKNFVVFDSYADPRYRVVTSVVNGRNVRVQAVKDEKSMEFPSLRRTAEFFKVDRVVIQSRLDNDNDLDGWTFKKLAVTACESCNSLS